ncbi:MAG: translocation/assembly module TamB domain-containing protein [Kaiparowitsia implicata GSE-PSE-MK54-09C]|nr:translocation/assembly module TamB domain-containing protein [Kaiparowitsia implicata GSE-PSE-MK54-09C]
MTTPPNPNRNSPRSKAEDSRRVWRQVGLGVGTVVLVGGVTGALWVRNFVRFELVPLIATQLSNTLNRPVELGPIEAISFTGVTLGQSALPATASDRDRATIDTVRVNFNPLEVLTTRQLDLDVTLDDADIYVAQVPDGRWITTQLQPQDGPDGPISINLERVRLRDARLTLAPSLALMQDSDKPGAAENPGVASPVTFDDVQASVRLREDGDLVKYDVDATSVRGGRVRVGGETQLDPQRTRVLIQTDAIAANEVSALLAVPVTLDEGTLFSNLTLTINGDTLESLDGTVRFQGLAGLVQNVPQPFSRANGRLRFRERLITLDNVRATYGTVPAVANGTVHLDNGYDLGIRVRDVLTENIWQTAQVDLPFPIEGALNGNATLTGPLERPRIRGTIDNSRPLQVDQVAVDRIQTRFDLFGDRLFIEDLAIAPSTGGSITGQGDLLLGETGELSATVALRDVGADAIAQGYGLNLGDVRIGTVSADIRASGPVNQLETETQWRTAQGTYPGSGEISTVGNRVQFRDAEFAVNGGQLTVDGSVEEGQWQAIAQASGIDLAPFLPNITGQIITGRANLTGNLQTPGLTTIQGVSDATLQIAGGAVTVQANAERGLWQADIVANDVLLRQFSPDLQGLFDGDLSFNGSLANLSPRAIRGAGEVAFSRGLPLLERPLTASVQWLGDRLQIDQATGPGVSASGFVLAQLDGPRAPRFPGFNLDVDVQDVELASLPVDLPPNLQVVGLAGFRGNVSGTPSVPNAAGTLQLTNLIVNRQRFEPLSGPIQYTGNQGLDVDVRGQRDRIATRLNAQNRPEFFFVQQGDAVAQGSTEGDRLTAQLTNFPIAALNLIPPPEVGLGNITGQATGNLDINLATLDAAGNLTIARPGVGHIVASGLRTQFRYSGDELSLTNTELRFDNSRYLIAAAITNLDTNPTYQGQIVADQGEVNDVLTALQWFRIDDVGRGLEGLPFVLASTVDPQPVGDPNAPLIDQLRRYAEITALLQLQEEAQEQQIALPELGDLRGRFTGQLNFSGSQQAGVAADFSLRGQDWTWAEYQVDQVIADGSLTDGVVELLPLQLRTDESFLTFSGRVGGDQQSGQLEAANVPVEAIRDFFRLPVDATGSLNANAVLEGSVENPQALGELTIVNARLNQTPIRDVSTRFNYDDARLRFLGQMQLAEEDPLRVSGSIPYSFPFMAVEPESDAIVLNARIRDDALALLNLFNDQVAWLGGNGEIDVAVTGTLAQPIVVGSANFEGASIAAVSLPEPLTDVSGTVQFNRSLVDVERLEGRFRQGQVVASGVLPISNPDEFVQIGNGPENPLTVDLNQLVLNFKGLYQGQVDGDLLITGTALAPVVSGDMMLSRGRVELPSGAQPVNPEPPEINPEAITSPPRFENLRITLGDRLRITLDPILNFVAQGDLLIGGTLNDLRPSGEIRLTAGQVNLFTSQFSLVRGAQNSAEFSPNRGLDPFLNVELQTIAQEVSRIPGSSASAFAAAEIAETPITDIGQVGTVRVRASVMGPASRIFDNLELTSSPSRSENEIVVLLGGGFVDTLGQGSGTLAIANLAGSAVLTRVQNFVSNAVGLTDFRLFPTVVAEGGANSSLELASELGVDITNTISASTLVVLTADVPAQFNLRYRINDEFLLRGFYDTAGGTGGVLQFERRF